MTRINISNSPRWFNRDKAEKFEGESFHNGKNWIQKQTMDQWTGQNLYLTASGNWVLACWSSWQGSIDTYEIINPEAAAQWLIVNESWEEVEKRFPKILQENEI